MTDLPTVSGREAIRVFKLAGWTVDRIRGSHHILKKEAVAKRLSVPVHGNRDLPSGTLRSLIAAAGMTVEEFQDLRG